MRLASWAFLGSLLINLAFGLIVAGTFSVARPVVATALAQCTHRHAGGAVRRPAVGHYLAAVRMGWAVG
jgi:hypothetical protein